jgi:hypothetical protein
MTVEWHTIPNAVWSYLMHCLKQLKLQCVYLPNNYSKKRLPENGVSDSTGLGGQKGGQQHAQTSHI